MGMENITGTPKQIAWAEEIREVAVRRLSEYQEAGERLIADYGEEARPAVEAAIARITTETSARWWIDHKTLGTDLPGIQSARFHTTREAQEPVENAMQILGYIAEEEQK